MADNYQAPNGQWLSSDDIGNNVDVPRVKVQFGVDGTATDVSSLNPMPVSPGNFPTGLNYTATSVTITANMAAGTDPIVAANSSRRAIQFGSSANFQIALAQNQSTGLRVYAASRDSFVGAECPLDALYLVSGSGLRTGNVLTVWEA